MKVLLLTPGLFDKGGISRYTRYQTRALRESRRVAELRIFSLAGRRVDDFEEPIDATWAGPTSIDFAGRMLFVWEVLRAVRGFGPDVIVSGVINLGPLAAVASSMVEARYVQNIYGRELWSGLSATRRRACRRASVVLSDCANTLDRARQMKLVRSEGHVVHDCVDLSRFTPGQADRSALLQYGLQGTAGRFRILLLGRLNATTRYKGTERVIRLLQHLPDSFEVVLAGGGDDLDHLRSLASSLGVGERVLVPGSVAESHLVDVYRSAHVFYLVSSVGYAQGEGLPLTPIEAMACGVPVVVGSEDGSREILSSGGGVTVGPKDLPAAAAYIRRLNTDLTFAEDEAQRARMRVVEEFSFDSFSSRTLDAVLCSPSLHAYT